MATAPFNPDESVPGDTDIAANFPAIYRTMVDIFESWLLVEHDRNGHHVFDIDTTTNRDSGTWQDGAFFYNTTVNALQFRIGDAWDTITLAKDTLALFQQTTAPVGWTKQTTHNDKALRVVSGTASSGGTHDFSSVFDDYDYVDDTSGFALQIDHIPPHTHSMDEAGGTNFISGANRLPTGNGAGSGVTGSTGGGQAHWHDILVEFNLDVKYVDVIIAKKD